VSFRSPENRSIQVSQEPWGPRRFFVRDPNGVVVNVVGHPD
jgi:hypothetical protein